MSAQHQLGVAYNLGIGVTQDYKEAVKRYRLAAEQGSANAQLSLGLMYAHGQGVAQDYKEAVKWYRLAAEQGNQNAQLNVGWIYRNGHGVTQDYVRAYMWLNFAVASLIGEDRKTATENRNRLAEKMTSAQIAQAQELARKCQQSNFRDCGW